MTGSAEIPASEPERSAAANEPVRLHAAATRLAAKGHPWFYRDDLAGGWRGAAELVRVVGHDGRDLGVAVTSPRSRIAVRLCGAWSEPDLDPEAFFRQRLQRAVERRAHLRGPRSGARLVHAEADGVPGLVVDEYGPCLVIQVTSAAVERYLSCIVPALGELTGAHCVVGRNDVAVREREGLRREVTLLSGRRLTEVEIEEHGVVYLVRPFQGQKTGFYLDQREARARVQALGRGRRVLDLFSYQAGFSLAALAGGAVSALAVDESADALQLAEESARRTGVQGLEVRKANAFDAVREIRSAGQQFDLVIVDPPAFAKSRRELRGAKRGYRDLNRNALRVLAPDGYLVTCSCSYHVRGPMFEDLLRQAAAGLPFRVVLRERLMAGEDHPAWISLPESEYLKVCVLQRCDP